MSNTRKPPVKLGEVCRVEITGLGHSGEGVGKHDSYTIFVSGALPGETVSARITEVKKNYARGLINKINKSSQDRCQPVCEIYDKCGGCQLQHLIYPAQLAAKQQQVSDAMNRLAKMPDIIIHKTIGAQNPWFYRNKMQFPVGMNNGKVAIGCFAAGSHAIIDTNNCSIQHEINNTIAEVVKKAISKLDISIYNEQTGQGFLRHVMGRVGQATGEVMVVLITTPATFLQQDKFISELVANIPGVVSIIQNINPHKTNIILGETFKTLWGKDNITEKIGELKFFISARSFFQVNTFQTGVLYEQVKKFAALTGTETIIDAYCGTGTISLFLAQQAHKVYGIEIINEAIDDANRNAACNNIENAEFITGDTLQSLPTLYKQGIIPDTIVVDPPRSGCDKGVLEAFVQMHPKKIIYVSCNPASLARDLAILNEQGYTAIEIQPVDMFPHTYHVESVCLILPK